MDSILFLFSILFFHQSLLILDDNSHDVVHNPSMSQLPIIDSDMVTIKTYGQKSMHTPGRY